MAVPPGINLQNVLISKGSSFSHVIFLKKDGAAVPLNGFTVETVIIFNAGPKITFGQSQQIVTDADGKIALSLAKEICGQFARGASGLLRVTLTTPDGDQFPIYEASIKVTA